MTAWNSLGESIFQEYNDLQIIFFERRQKAFAGFLLDDRNEKKGVTMFLQPQQRTQLY